MIKGFYLRDDPFMTDISETKVLSEIDLNREVDSVIEYPEEGQMAEKHTYESDLLMISVFEIPKESGYNALYEVYSLLEKANPNYIKVIKKSKTTLIVAYPNFSEIEDDDPDKYDRLIEELVRVSVFLLRHYYSSESMDTIVEYLRDYIKICVSTPTSREE